MKVYPELPNSQILGTVEQLRNRIENDIQARATTYKKYKRVINVIKICNYCSGGFTGLCGSGSIVSALTGIGLPVSVGLGAGALMGTGVSSVLSTIKHKLETKAKKHDRLKVLAETKLNSINEIVAKALQDGNISMEEYSIVRAEYERYRQLFEEIRNKSKQVASIDEEQKKLLIKQGRQEAVQAIQKNLGQ